MIKEGLEYLIEIGRAIRPYRETVDGVEYADSQLQVINPPRPESLGFSRLQGFVDFVLLERERLDRAGVLIYVASPWKVCFGSTLDLHYRDREVYAVATSDKSHAFKFGEFMAPEQFVISAQTLIANYDNDADLARLLALVGNVGAEQIATNTDDGISQTVAVKAGITLVKRREIDNPFHLRPFRTFAEIKQPESPFILRARQTNESAVPTLALFECDNGAWEIDAIAAIADWLKAKITDIPILA